MSAVSISECRSISSVAPLSSVDGIQASLERLHRNRLRVVNTGACGMLYAAARLSVRVPW